MHPVHLSTINLDPNRWRPDLPPLVRASEWTAPAREAGFSGLELWQRHVLEASAEELAQLGHPPLAPAIFSAYGSFEERPEACALRERIAAAIRDTASCAVKDLNFLRSHL
jgi:sugar phosphate isomerase/epimerase